jgi:two-component system, NarL family, nitrate/nitrite sensor histidine kinase NarX
MSLFSTQIYRSVIFQILMAMLFIAAMALASMSMSVYVTVDTQGDAEAINLAGSLRMRSYRIAYLLSRAGDGKLENPLELLATEREQFAEKLYRSNIFESIEASGNTPLQKSYRKVVEQWRDQIDPLLASVAATTGEVAWKDIEEHYHQDLDAYVDDIDTMVMQLQRNTEGKIELLGMTEGVSIILILFILMFFIMKADNNFIVPLRALVQAAERVKKGDLAHRTSYTGDNELGLLSQTFNDMTESLQVQYRTLEDQVTERTQKLHQSNQALYFLYKTSREISSSPYDHDLMNIFLSDLKKVIEVEVINLCVNAEPNFIDYEIITTSKDKDTVCFGDCADCDMAQNPATSLPAKDISLPLKNREDEFGFIYVRTREGKQLESWQYQLLKTVTETLSTAFAFHHTLGQERRVILHEERSTIARELHDSLAQSLSYMKLEVARLKKMTALGLEPDKIASAISDLQEGLNAAYKHLRELLVTFRVKLDAPNLRTALEHAVREFDEKTTATITLDYALSGFALSPNEDIHIVHILREALSNAVKHSQADTISLRCHRNSAGEAVFTVDDNGIGMSEHPEKEHHYGIYTMRERAQRLAGILTCSRRQSGGTRVKLQLQETPKMLSA